MLASFRGPGGNTGASTTGNASSVMGRRCLGVFLREDMNQEPLEPDRKPNEVPGPDRPGNPDDPGRHPGPLPPDQEPVVPVREPITPMPATDPQPPEPMRL